MENFLFPNELHNYSVWSLMIVLYPFIAGFEVGAFIVSSLYYRFGRKELKDIIRLAKFSSLCFLLIAPMPLLLHLGKPLRAFNVLLYPNFTSAMAGFGYLYSAYLLVVVLKVWFTVRPEIIEKANAGGLQGKIFRILALGQTDPITEEAAKIDKKAINVLALIGLPLAIVMIAYIGFIFASIKVNVWWNSPLLPIIFVFSAILTGTALQVIIYFLMQRKNINLNTVKSLRNILFYTFCIYTSFILLDILQHANKADVGWETIMSTIGARLSGTYIYSQLLLLTILPFALFVYSYYQKSEVKVKVSIFIASLLMIVQVFFMLMNTIIGGQYFSKSTRGVLDFQVPFLGIMDIQVPLLGKEGMLVGMVLVITPLVLLFLINKIFPIFYGLNTKSENE